MTYDEIPKTSLSTPLCLVISVLFPIMGVIFFRMHPHDNKGKLSLLAGIISACTAFALLRNR